MSKTDSPSGPFAGVRVVELAQFVFIPGAGVMLADLGADVIHVEDVSGDPYRSMQLNDGRNLGEINLAMEQNNRNKRSLAVNLKADEGREMFMKLIETADVFATSVRPQAIDRLGLGIEDLRKRNPALIYVRGNGLGYRGAEAERPGLDMSAFWARGGFASVYTPQDAAALTRARGALGDHSASLSAAFGIAAALFKRAATGEPSVVEASLLSTAMWILSADIVAALNNPAYHQDTFSSQAHQFPLLCAYRTRDGRWLQLVMMDSQRFWPEVCGLLGRPELAADPRFVDVASRAANGRECVAIIADTIGARDWADWKQVFAQLDGPWELVASIQDVCADPQAAANGYVLQTRVKDHDLRTVAGPVSFDGSPHGRHAIGSSPALGQHTDEILQDLGMGRGEIERMRAAGVIA